MVFESWNFIFSISMTNNKERKKLGFTDEVGVQESSCFFFKQNEEPRRKKNKKARGRS